MHAGGDTVELAPLVDSLNGLLARMDAAIAHERRWTMDAAHELRTPLTAIKTHVQVAQLVLDQAGPPAQTGDALRQAQEGIGHMHATLGSCCSWRGLESASARAAPRGAGRGHRAYKFALAVRQSRASVPRTRAGWCPLLRLQVLPRAGRRPTPWAQARFCPAASAAHRRRLSTCWTTPCTPPPGRDPVLRHAAVAEDAAGAAIGDSILRDQGGPLPAECAQAAQRFWRKTASGPGCGLGLTIVHRIAESVGGTLVLPPCIRGWRHG